jgi:hypothetical protein
MPVGASHMHESHMVLVLDLADPSIEDDQVHEDYSSNEGWLRLIVSMLSKELRCAEIKVWQRFA